MAKGLDELIDWLVAETAYCGEAGFRVDDFVSSVSRFSVSGRTQPKAEDVDADSGINGINNASSNDDINGTPSAGDTVDMPLARNAWKWLVARPEILVGHKGDRGHLTLDEALALPEAGLPEPVDDDADADTNAGDDDAEDQKIDLAAAGSKKATSSRPKSKLKPKNKKTQKTLSLSTQALAAAANDDPSTRPRLYATEKTIWYTLTGHDVDYKKIPMLEWKCLQGIASARTRGILQADLRELVDQDKRSVPKRTDFLAAKGYAVKRTTIARGYRTSMLWLTEFAPIELDAEPTTSNITNKNDGSTEDAPALLSSKDLAKNGIDFSPEFLKKDREPVPWRNRWLGEAIEFASFGQTILAIVKAWGVIRLVDLKIKLGIMGMRWQMRTLARATREFVASGILKFVAAMRADETQLFKDCIKFERDPTPSEWAVYLAAGRKRAPMTEMRAKFKREQSRFSGYGGYNGNDNMSEMDMASAIDDEDEDMLDPNGTNDNEFSLSAPAWAIDVPLVNLIFDVVDRAGIDGITSPQICRATLGPSFARYIFSLVTALSRPSNQPDHLTKFQLHCEPTRLGKNKAYLFRTLANAKVAERINNGESIESIEQEAAETAAAEKARIDKIEELRASGKLVGQPANDVARLYGFTPLGPPMTAEELAAQKAKYSTPHSRRKSGRPLKYRLIAGEGTPGGDAGGSLFEASEAGTPTPKRRGRPPKVREPEEDTEMVDADVEGHGNNADNRSEDVVAPTPPPPKRRGRPPKAKPVDIEADDEVEPSTPKRGRGRPPKTVQAVEPEGRAEAEEDGPVPTVRLGEPNSLGPKSVERRGRRKRSIVVIFHLDQLRDPIFLEEQKGYKEGAIRVEPGEDEDGDEDGDGDEDAEGEEAEMEVDADENQEGKESTDIEPAVTLPHITALAADLEPVATRYDGKLGHLTVDIDEKTVQFTYAIPRRGRRPAQPREPITITADSLVNKPVIRDDGDGQALVLNVRKDNTEDAEDNNEEAETTQEGDATSPYIFILDQAEGNGTHLSHLLNILVALQAHNQPQEAQPEPEQEKGPEEAGTTSATPTRGRGRLPGQKNKKKGRVGRLVAAAAADNGPTEFVCETCRGTWKNLLGLQYHQTKARTACNPNYVPISAEDKALKKQQEREEREKQRQAAEEAKRAEQAEIAQNGGRAGRAGRALRELKQPAGAFRETSPISAGSTGSLSHSPMRSPSPSSDTPEPTASSPSPRKDASQSQGRLQSQKSQASIKIHGNRRRTVRLQEPDSSDDDTPTIRRRGITLPVLKDLQPGDKEANDLDFDSDEEPTVAPAQPQPQVEDTPMEDSGYVVQDQDQEPEPVTAVEPTGESQYPSLDIDDAATPPPYDGSAQHDPNQSLIDSPHKMGPAGFRMPPLPKNSQKLSPQSLRSYIIMEITKYLVDCFGGIFPGDRSLWYAAFHIYTRTFPGEEPPNMTVIKAAVKKLEIAKEIEEHTFGFRDARGQFIYCRLLARPGTDLFASATAIDFKKRIQTSFPQPYVPVDFAPSDRDLAILKALDKDNSRNSRGRRPLQPEIEVLKAPFYEQPQVTRATNNAVRLVGYDDDDEVDSAGPNSRQRTPNGKRKSMLTAGDLTGVGGGGPSSEPTPKRRKVRNIGPFAENSLYRTLGGSSSADATMEDDPEADIDPALRTVRPTPASRLVNVTTTVRNPGLDSLPASFFLPDDEVLWNRSRTKPTQVRTEGNDGFTTFIHFLPPNTGLASGDDDDDGGDRVEEDSDYDYDKVGKHVAESTSKLPQPRTYKIVTKTHTLYDLRRSKTSPRPWPVVSETTFQRQSDASFTMDGFMPTRKALVRANLPRTPADCAAMLRGNNKPNDFTETPEGIFNRDVESCLSWEISVPGTDLLRNPSVAPRYVFFHMAFPGAHYTAEDAEAQQEGRRCADTYAHPPLRWNRKNLYSVNTIPYGALDGGITNTNATETALNTLAPTTPAQRKKWTRSATEIAVQREKQAQQAKYGTSSRREMTAYPQTPDDYVQDLTASASAAAGGGIGGGMNWSANDTLVAAFVVVRTLLGGVSQVVDWGLMMRLFPDRRLSALRNFWKNTRRERQPHIDKFTERFQEAYLAAYERKAIPPIDYDNVLAYDWGWLVGWALKLMRHDANNLPDTRRALEQDYTLVNLPQSRMVNWRDDFFHPARSVWNRLHDTTSEPAAVSIDIDCKDKDKGAVLVTPTEAAAAGRLDKLRYMVARSWIRALCGTPHSRYQPSHIKRQLLTLGSLGTLDSVDKEGDVLDETTANNLLQEVIGDLTTDRILRRTKSLISLGGRMYTLTEAYENTLEKLAMEEKFRQAFAFKERLDTCFAGQGQPGKATRTPSFDIPVNTNDDGMVMALMNLQAHGRVRVEAVDAPHIPFGFEPGNYESRKFPKHYQRFRTRIVPTDRYVYNGEDTLKGALKKVASAVGREDKDDKGDKDDKDSSEVGCPPRKGPYQEMPIWRDFFGVLDRTWFARLAGAVVFLLATRGATPVQQAAAQLRPTIEPFEVQMIFEWATKAGILVDRVEDDGSRGVAEWWWLLVGQVHMSAGKQGDAVDSKKQVEGRAAETAKP